MKALHHIITTATVLLAVSATAQLAAATDRAPQRIMPRAITDPLKLIYRTSGVRDNGGAENTGTATSFDCTNYSNFSENVRFRILNYNGTLVADQTRTLNPDRTLTVSTHGTLKTEDLPFLSPGVSIAQGHAIISATSLSVICSVTVVDAAAATPIGTPLHLMRRSPLKNTSE